jgi:hypothetical protein
MIKEILYNPFTDKDVMIDPYGRLAKRIYRLYIEDMEISPQSILPPNLNYNKKSRRFNRIKIIKDFKNVKRITYKQLPPTASADPDVWGYFYSLFKNYAGQTIKLAKKYTYKDQVSMEETIESIPPVADGFASWWHEIGYFFMIDSETNIFSAQVNDGLEPKFQTQVVLLTLDKVKEQNYSQYFMEGVTNCLFKPIKEWGEDKLKDATGRTAKYVYKKFIKDCNIYEKDFDKGVPENKIAEICNRLQIGIEIDLPSTLHTKTKFIQERSQKQPKKIFKYINTRLNHIELNEVRSLNQYETVSKEELQQIFDNEKNFKMWKQARLGITQVNTLNKIYKLSESEGFIGAVNEFEELNNLSAYKIEYYDNPPLSKFLKDNCHSNQSIVMCEDEDFDYTKLKHIDMKKSYTRGMDCGFYEGYLGKITDFRKIDKIDKIGIYQISNINFNGNTLIEKLKVIHEGNAYPSPELKFYQSLGITFDILGGCWGSSIDIKFPDRMYEEQDNIPHYCRWYGITQMMSFKTRYKFNCTRIEDAQLNSYNNKDADIRYDYSDQSGIIEYKKPKVFHQCHIASFVTSYARINLIEQLRKFKDINNIIAVQVDGLYYEGDVELTPLFRTKEKITINSIDTDYYVENKNNDKYEFPEYRKFNQIEVHTGPGGCGKTHYNLTDKGLCGILYVAPSYKLARNKEKEYGINTGVHKWLTSSREHKWMSLFNTYSTIIIDEISMLNNDDKNIILKRFNNHKLIFCGDLGYQLPPIEGRAFKIQELPVIEHHNNRRCKCRKLQRVLNFIRERIREDKDFLINIPGDYLFDIKIIGKDDFDYKVEDLIICPYNSRKDYFTEKYKDLEKYTVTANTTDYSNGDILYQKIKGVEMELRHAFTIHAIQGETAKNKLYIDLKGIRSLTMLYTAFSRAEYLDQISLFK